MKIGFLPKMNKIIAVIAAGLLTAYSHVSAFETYAVRASPNNTLYRFDASALGSPQAVGVVPLGGDLSELVAASQNSLYTVDRSSNTLLEISTVDASIISQAALDTDVPIAPRGFDLSPSGLLYGVFPGGGSGIQLKTINPQTGQTTFVCSITGALLIEAIAFSPDGVLYAVGSPTTSINPSHHLYTLDYSGPSSGQLNLVGELNFVPLGFQGKDVDSLTFGPDGFLYGADALAGYNAQLYKINPVTAEVTNLGATGVLELNGLAAAYYMNDRDGDGVPDDEDLFPDDPKRATIIDHINCIIDYVSDDTVIFDSDWKKKRDRLAFINKLEAVLELVTAAETTEDPEEAAALYAIAARKVERDLIKQAERWLVTQEAKDIIIPDLEFLSEYLAAQLP